MAGFSTPYTVPYTYLTVLTAKSSCICQQGGEEANINDSQKSVAFFLIIIIMVYTKSSYRYKNLILLVEYTISHGCLSCDQGWPCIFRLVITLYNGVANKTSIEMVNT